MADLAKMGFKGRTADAVALVLDKGYTQYRAAKEIGVDQAAVSRMLKKLAARRAVCGIKGCQLAAGHDGKHRKEISYD